MEKEYSSPRKKLLRFFERSRNRWKEKCRAAKTRIKALQTTISDLRTSRDRWKKEAWEARKEIAQLRAEVEELKSGCASAR